VITTERQAAVPLVALFRGQATPMLANHAPFRTIMTRCAMTQRDAQIEWYVDPLATVKAFMRGNLAAAAGLALLPAIGADGVRAIGGQIVVADDEFDLLSRTHLLLEPPRDGVVEVVALSEGSVEPEPWVPADAAAYVTWNIDFQRGYGAAKKLIESFRGKGSVKQFVDRRVSERLGVDFEEALLPAFTGRLTQVAKFPPHSTIADAWSVYALEIKDPESFAPILTKITDKWSDRLDRQVFAGINVFQLRLPDNGNEVANAPAADEPAADDDDNGERRRNRRRQQPWAQTPPVVALVGSHLIVANRREALEQCIVTFSDSGQTRLKDELDVKLVMSKLRRQSQTPPCMMRFERPEQGLRAMYELLQSEDVRRQIHERRDSNPFFAALDDAFEANRFPAFAVISQYFAPSGSILFNEETGFHHVSFGLRRRLETPSTSQ
jgi:hypothetical protein